MASQAKAKTYVVHHRGRADHGGFTVLGRYLVGAKNQKEAEQLLRDTLGKHVKVAVYYEVKEGPKLKYKQVIKDTGGQTPSAPEVRR